MIKDTFVIAQTQSWIETVVIGLNFCPFARKEMESHRVKFTVCEGRKPKDVLSCFLAECQVMDQDVNIETVLVILPEGFGDFSTYLNIVDTAQQLLEMDGYEGIYQLASFHPEYCFAGEELDDPANFTNRSPYPILHILRERSLERSLRDYDSPESIPEKNISLTRSMGFSAMQELCDEAKNV